METHTDINSQIAKWLGFETFEINEKNSSLSVIQDLGTGLCARRFDGISFKCDFLYDRNQQKWIEDKLEENGYVIFYEFITEWKIEIIKNEIDIVKYNQSKDLAFIQVVEQLIDKENKEGK